MKNLRGINVSLIEKFKDSPLKELVEGDESLLAFIRDNAIGLYYNCDRIAMVKEKRDGSLKCEINGYYLDGKSGQKNREQTPEEIAKQIDVIKRNSEGKKHGTEEKKAQQALVSRNNDNPRSKWFCFDIEYRQAKKAQGGSEDYFDGRFDILALSKEAPHRIAVIELKFNSGAIGGESGIVKHLKDFKKFNDSDICKENLREEAQTIIKNLRGLEVVKVPESLCKEGLTFSDGVEFYVICLYEGDNSPKGTVDYYRKKCEESSIVLEENFLYKKVDSATEIGITDILDKEQYDK